MKIWATLTVLFFSMPIWAINYTHSSTGSIPSNSSVCYAWVPYAQSKQATMDCYNVRGDKSYTKPFSAYLGDTNNKPGTEKLLLIELEMEKKGYTLIGDDCPSSRSSWRCKFRKKSI